MKNGQNISDLMGLGGGGFGVFCLNKYRVNGPASKRRISV